MSYTSGFVLSLAAFAIGLSACSDRPERAPPSARVPIEVSAAGLTKLFKDECIEQRNSRWIREESQRRYRDCDVWNPHPCEVLTRMEVDWEAPTTGGANVEVKMYVGGGSLGIQSNTRPLFCRLSIPEFAEPHVPRIVENLKAAGHAVTGPFDRDSTRPAPEGLAPRIEVSRWASSADHRKAVGAFRAERGETGPLRPDDPLLLSHEPLAARPWVIEYIPY